MTAIYADRRDAGRRLVGPLRDLGVRPALVLGVPRGGVPVAFEVARGLAAPLDVLLVRKLGVPGQEELAMGAIASGGLRVLNDALLSRRPEDRAMIDSVTARETRELGRRERCYRQGRPPLDLEGRELVVVDDGLATGATMRAALASLRRAGAATITVAVPVGAPSVCDELAAEVDALVCPARPERFGAVGSWYREFGQTEDGEVCALLRAADWLAAD